MSDDPYVYPGTETLINLQNITDPDLLRQREYELTKRQHTQLSASPSLIPRTFDQSHIKAIHAHLFSPLYSWAGEYRTIDMEKMTSVFARTRDIPRVLDLVSAYIDHQPWESLTQEDFIKHVAYTYAHVNFAHPFREGNGRTGKLFLTHLAEQSPFAIDYTRASKEQWNMMSELSTPVDFFSPPTTEPLEYLFSELIIPRPDHPIERQQDALEHQRLHQASLYHQHQKLSHQHRR